MGLRNMHFCGSPLSRVILFHAMEGSHLRVAGLARQTDASHDTMQMLFVFYGWQNVMGAQRERDPL